MFDFILNIMTLGIRPLFLNQKKFHDLILEFRIKFSNPGRAHLVYSDIGEFYERLGSFNFKRVFFRKYYEEYRGHLERFKPEMGDVESSLTFLRIALAENKWKPTRPLPVMVHHLKYEFKFTANPFITYQKKQQRKKLDALGTGANTTAKPKQSQNWTRVPLKHSKGSS